MRRMDFAGFNKEKLIFVVTSVIFSVALYLFLVSGPVSLQDEKPIGTQASPAPLDAHDMTQQRDENYYVARAGLTRKTPFAPASDFVRRDPPKVVNNNTPPPPPPPPPPPEKKEPEITKTVWDAKDLDIQVEYMGVMSLNGETYALVKPKDGGNPRRLKVGDKLSDFGYEVTDIEKQGILMKDAEGRPFELKDSRFSDDEVASGDDTEKKTDHKTDPKKTEQKKTEQKKQEQKKPEKPAPAPQQPAPATGTQTEPPRGSHERRPRPGGEARPTKKKGVTINNQ